MFAAAMSPRRTYTLEKFADECGETVRCLRRLIAEGKLGCHQDGPGATIKLTIDLWDEYLDSNEKEVEKSKPATQAKRRRRRGAKAPSRSRRESHRDDRTIF
jgi:hypothetical protein